MRQVIKGAISAALIVIAGYLFGSGVMLAVNQQTEIHECH